MILAHKAGASMTGARVTDAAANATIASTTDARVADVAENVIVASTTNARMTAVNATAANATVASMTDSRVTNAAANAIVVSATDLRMTAVNATAANATAASTADARVTNASTTIPESNIQHYGTDGRTAAGLDTPVLLQGSRIPVVDTALKFIHALTSDPCAADHCVSPSAPHPLRYSLYAST